MTHLSDLPRRMREAGDGPNRFIFATGDRGLAEVARLLTIDAEPGDLEAELVTLMSTWWPKPDVEVLAAAFASALLTAERRPAPVGPGGVEDPIAFWISVGEDKVREWLPRAA